MSTEIIIRLATRDEREALESLQRRASLMWAEYREALLAHPLRSNCLSGRSKEGALKLRSGDARSRVSALSFPGKTVTPIWTDCLSSR